MSERDVVEFIIIPPLARRHEIVQAKERMEDYLSRRFPKHIFRVSPFAVVDDEDLFCVLPIMNFLGDDGKAYMCNDPGRWLMREIAQACEEFDANGSISCAA